MDKSLAHSDDELRAVAVSTLIPRLARVHRSHVFDPLKQLGLSPGQELMLMRLWDTGPQNQASLAATLGVTAPTVAKTVTRLEQKGFVLRQKSAEDGRAAMVTLTDKGRALRPQVEQIWTGLEERTLDTLTAAEQEILKDLIIRLIGNLESVD